MGFKDRKKLIIITHFKGVCADLIQTSHFTDTGCSKQPQHFPVSTLYIILINVPYIKKKLHSINKVKIKVKVCDVILFYFDFYHTFIITTYKPKTTIIVKNFIHLIYISNENRKFIAQYCVQGDPLLLITKLTLIYRVFSCKNSVYSVEFL